MHTVRDYALRNIWGKIILINLNKCCFINKFIHATIVLEMKTGSLIYFTFFFSRRYYKDIFTRLHSQLNFLSRYVRLQ